MDQGPTSRFDLASGRLDRVQFIFVLKSAGDLIEARVAGHGYLVVLASDPKPPIRIGAWRGAKYEKIFQLAALFVLARGGQHHLAQLRLTPAFLGHVSSPCAQFTKPAVLHRQVGALCCVQLPMRRPYFRVMRPCSRTSALYRSI